MLRSQKKHIAYAIHRVHLRDHLHTRVCSMSVLESRTIFSSTTGNRDQSFRGIRIFALGTGQNFS